MKQRVTKKILLERLEYLKLNAHKMNIYDVMEHFGISKTCAYATLNNNGISYLKDRSGKPSAVAQYDECMFNEMERENWLI